MKQVLIALMLSGLLLSACGRSSTPEPTPEPTLDLEATVQAGVVATLTAWPTDTPMPTPTESPAPTPTPTPPPTPTPTPGVTEEPDVALTPMSEVTGTPAITATASAIVATEDVALRVRGGPSTDYTTLGGLQPGTELALLARSSDNQWFQIAYPADTDQRGWVSGEFLEIQDSPDQLPIAQVPPAPTPGATEEPGVAPTPMSDVTGTPAITATASAIVVTEGDVLLVRGGPGTDYTTLGSLEAGTELTLLARLADNQWFQIAYPADTDQRGWVMGEFLEIQGSADQLPIAQAPTPLTIQTVDACAPIPGEVYGTLAITSAPTDPPAESHADLNLNLRSYVPTDASSALIDLPGSGDPNAPQLRGLFEDRREPEMTGAYQVYGWDWGVNVRGPLIGEPEVTLLGMQTTPGEIINMPDGGGNLGQGYAALVLYASPSRITLKYTPDDNVVDGYTIHIENVCVEPTLLALYQQMNNNGRGALPALRVGQPLGRATGSEIGVAVRDKGSFMDPRSRKDWW